MPRPMCRVPSQTLVIDLPRHVDYRCNAGTERGEDSIPDLIVRELPIASLRPLAGLDYASS